MLEEAVLHCQEALHVRPDFAEAHNNLGTARLNQGRVDEAIRHWQRALSIRPDFAEVHYNLANVLHAHRQEDQAIHHWRQALRCRPDYPEAHYNLGNTLLVKGSKEEALDHYQQAIRLRPHYAEAHCNLGNALESQGKLPEAVPHWQQALAIQPELPEAHNNLGNALLRMGRREAAAAHCVEAIRLKSDFAEAWTTLGNIRQHQSNFAEALACYEKALLLDPNHGETHLNRALLWLLQGNWSQGWVEFEWRWQTKDFTPYSFRQPRWDGSPLDGRTLFVLAEQGLGDTFQFIRYVRWLRQRGGRVIAACQSALFPILAQSLGPQDLVKAGEAVPTFDVYAPLLSLPGILGDSITNVPAEVPYLQTDPTLVEQWRSELASLAGIKVGIAWQGKPTYGFDQIRSIPLRHFSSLAQVKGVQLVSLQKGPGMEQVKEQMDKFPLLDLGNSLDESSGAFQDTAAVMKCLDLVITSDTAIAHLAGALGVAVWVALPLVPDWRWMLHREDSPWYPTMRLFRQTQYGKWDDVFERIAEEIGRLPTVPALRQSVNH